MLDHPRRQCWIIPRRQGFLGQARSGRQVRRQEHHQHLTKISVRRGRGCLVRRGLCSWRSEQQHEGLASKRLSVSQPQESGHCPCFCTLTGCRSSLSQTQPARQQPVGLGCVGTVHPSIPSRHPSKRHRRGHFLPSPPLSCRSSSCCPPWRCCHCLAAGVCPASREVEADRCLTGRWLAETQAAVAQSGDPVGLSMPAVSGQAALFCVPLGSIPTRWKRRARLLFAWYWPRRWAKWVFGGLTASVAWGFWRSLKQRLGVCGLIRVQDC